MDARQNADGDHAGGDNAGESAAADEERSADGHLDDIEDGCGCTEVWEHLSDQRSRD
ncbi:MAG: hypothetical protein ABEJ26_05680 [Halosimplex sp.]